MKDVLLEVILMFKGELVVIGCGLVIRFVEKSKLSKENKKFVEKLVEDIKKVR